MMAIPGDVPGVLLFGGSFDPPHTGHIELASQAREAALPAGSWIVFVPAARSPHKSSGPIASDQDRVEMLRLATAHVERSCLWTDELDRCAPGEASYWIESVRRARRVISSGTKLWFLLGADQVAAFHRWKDYRQVLSLAEPVVMLRPPMDRLDTLDAALETSGAWSGPQREWWLSRVAPISIRGISATELRDVISTGGDPTGMLHPDVLAYIQSKGLYA